jgi:hypothetical protein
MKTISATRGLKAALLGVEIKNNAVWGVLWMASLFFVPPVLVLRFYRSKFLDLRILFKAFVVEAQEKLLNGESIRGIEHIAYRVYQFFYFIKHSAPSRSTFKLQTGEIIPTRGKDVEI